MTLPRIRTLVAICAALAAVAACGKSEPEPEPPAEASPPPAEMPAPTPEPVVSEPAAPPAAPPPAGEPDEFEEFVEEVEKGLLLAMTIKAAIEQTYDTRGELPQSAAELGSAARVVPSADDSVESITVRDGGVIVIDYAAQGDQGGGTIELSPTPGDDGIEWDCTGGTLPAEVRPDECR